MYTQHFGLEKAAFEGGIAQGDDLFLGPQQQRAAANLKIGLTTRDSVVTLTGRLGVGKTTIASEALRITATRLAQTWVGNAPLAPDEMLEMLLADFEFTPYDMGRVQRLHTWRQFMSEMSVTDTRICILVENAFALGLEALQALEALTAADPNDCPGANLVLMGPASLLDLLETPELAPLKQRIRSNQRLDPLTPEEVEQYLRHRITAVGGDYDTIFAPGTAAMLHCFSAGVLRVIKNVCDTALTVAATRRAPQLTPQIIQRVAEGVYGLAPSVELPDAAVAVAPAVAATPVAVEEQPAEAPEPAADPAPVVTASPVAVADQPAEAPVPAADPAPVDDAQVLTNAEVLVDDADAEPLQAASIFGTTDSVEHPAEPPILTETPVDDAGAEPLLTMAIPSTNDAVEDSPAPPVLTDAVDFDLPSDSEPVAGDAQPLAATLPPVSSAQRHKESQAEIEAFEDLAAATHLHEISESMAERLFSEEQGLTPESLLEADAPSEVGLSAEQTAVMRQLDEDSIREMEDDQADPAAPAATTMVY